MERLLPYWVIVMRRSVIRKIFVLFGRFVRMTDLFAILKYEWCKGKDKFRSESSVAAVAMVLSNIKLRWLIFVFLAETHGMQQRALYFLKCLFQIAMAYLYNDKNWPPLVDSEHCTLGSIAPAYIYGHLSNKLLETIERCFCECGQSITVPRLRCLKLRRETCPKCKLWNMDIGHGLVRRELTIYVGGHSDLRAFVIDFDHPAHMVRGYFSRRVTNIIFHPIGGTLRFFDRLMASLSSPDDRSFRSYTGPWRRRMHCHKWPYFARLTADKQRDLMAWTFNCWLPVCVRWRASLVMSLCPGLPLVSIRPSAASHSGKLGSPYAAISHSTMFGIAKEIILVWIFYDDCCLLLVPPIW